MSRVLLVDDDLDLLESLELLLGMRYAVRGAVDGHKALALLNQEPADVVVVDLIMPRMDGEALVAEMRARGFMAPVILASATPELAERAAELGVFASLRKPFHIQALERCLDAALQHGGGSDHGPTGSEPPSNSQESTDEPDAGDASRGDGLPSPTSSWTAEAEAEAARSWPCPPPSRPPWPPGPPRP